MVDRGSRTEFKPDKGAMAKHLLFIEIVFCRSRIKIAAMIFSTAQPSVPERDGASRLITVAICTRNRAAFLEKAIHSVLLQLTPDTELLVVDNASTDDTRQVCERLAKENSALGYFLETKLGLSVGRNTALKKACGEYILFLDDDAVAEAGWLEAYREFLKHPPSPKIAAVGGAVIPCYDRQPPWWIDSKHGGFDRGDKPLLLSNGALSGCNSAYHREAVRAVGLFDEQLGYKGDTLIPREESELQDRLIRAGWEIWWLPRAAVQHHVEDERLTVKGMARSAFNSGRAAAIHRLKITTPASRRLALRLTRLLATPFHITINLVQALLLFVLGKQRPAIGALCRVTRAAGWAWQMVKPY